jgi:hypothetical protein
MHEVVINPAGLGTPPCNALVLEGLQVMVTSSSSLRTEEKPLAHSAVHGTSARSFEDCPLWGELFLGNRRWLISNEFL